MNGFALEKNSYCSRRGCICCIQSAIGEMADRVMDGIDDRLSIGADVVDAVVEIEYPSERLLRRRDVVALRTEDDDRGADRAQVKRFAVRHLDAAGGQIVADKQFVND